MPIDNALFGSKLAAGAIDCAAIVPVIKRPQLDTLIGPVGRRRRSDEARHA